MTSKAQERYLSAKALGITPAEHKWLLRAGKMLITMQPGEDVQIKGDGLFRFNMGTAKRKTECGTSGCIAGLAHLLAETAGERLFRTCMGGIITPYSIALTPLFYPRDDRFSGVYSRMSPHAAGEATLTFLRTGKVKFPRDWKSKPQTQGD